MDEQAKNPHQWPSSAPDIAARRRAFGEKLKAAREQKGLSAQALSQLTRINQHYIEALEDGALERLPGAVFGRGFVRCITKNMRIEGDAFLDEFNTCLTEAAPTSVLKVEIKSKPPKPHAEAVARLSSTFRSLLRRGLIFKAALPVAAVVLGIMAVRHGGFHLPDVTRFLRAGTASVSTPEVAKGPVKELDLTPAKPADQKLEAPVAVQPEVAKASASSADPVKEATPASSPAKPVAETVPEPKMLAEAAEVTAQVLELTVTEPVRVRLDVDKGQPVTKELTPDTYRFSFNDKADLLIYDAAALKISFNGKQLGSLGAKGRVRKLSFQAAPPSQDAKNR